jgi:ABC-type multidrug transport system fused ATPase/permease subunit
MHDLKVLFRMTGGFRRFVILMLFRSPFDALYTAIQAMFLQFGFNTINDGNASKLYMICAFFSIGFGLLFLYNGTVWTLYATYTTKWVGTIRRKLFGHISRLSLLQIESRLSGDWITRLNADVQAATVLLGHPLHLPHAVCASVNILVSSIILICMNPTIYGLVMLFVISHILISQLIIVKPMTKLATNSLKATARNTSDMNALITCTDTAMLYDAWGFLLSRFERSSLDLRKSNMKMRHRSAMGAGLLPLMGMSGYLIILLVSGSWIAAGKMTFGDLTAAFQYRGGVLVGFMMLTSSLMNIKSALAGVKRVNETMQIPLEE